MLMVLAENYIEYMKYLHDHNYKPKDYVYLDKPERLKGQRNIKLIKIGYYERHPLFLNIKNELQAVGYSEIIKIKEN